jgi:hypothetical protein
MRLLTTFLIVYRRDKLMLMLRKKDDPTEQIFVFFPDEQKVGVKTIRRYQPMISHSNECI